MGKVNGKRVSFLLKDDTGRERVVTPVRRCGPRPRIPPPSPDIVADNLSYDNVKVKITLSTTLGEVKKLGIFRSCQVNLERWRPPPPQQPEVASSSTPFTTTAQVGVQQKLKKRYQCDQCSKRCSSRIGLFQHQKLHIPNRHQCKTCGKQCGNRFCFWYHRKTHLGFQPGGLRLDPKERPVHCSVCGKRFAHVSSLYHHTMKVTSCRLGGNAYRKLEDGRPSPKPFRCAKCSRSFVLKADLDHHLGFHR